MFYISMFLIEYAEEISCYGLNGFDENQLVYYVDKGVNWLYSTIDFNLIYTFKIWYYNVINQTDLFFLLWDFLWQKPEHQLLYSFYLDIYSKISINEYPFSNSWIGSFLNLKSSNVIIFYHPELLIYITKFDYFLQQYTSSYNIKIFNNIVSEVNIYSCTLLLHIIIAISLISLFIVILFSFYNNQNTDERTIDIDFLNTSILIESEKEITSIDDCLVLVSSIIFIFGFYFFSHAILIFSNTTPMFLTYYSLIITFIFILGMPTLLLYDLGIYFLLYLKGTGKSYNYFIEIAYDYIACIVFYTRIFAQWIRLVLMFVTYLSMSHYVAEFEITNNNIILNENKFSNLNNFDYKNSSISYYILSILPGKLIYWCYEVLHTLFLVTSQFVAFFAIVFWLILFLYTFFVIEKFEDFFSYKRKLKSLMNKKISNLK